MNLSAKIKLWQFLKCLWGGGGGGGGEERSLFFVLKIFSSYFVNFSAH